jgi:hypothetical protein
VGHRRRFMIDGRRRGQCRNQGAGLHVKVEVPG